MTTETTLMTGYIVYALLIVIGLVSALALVIAKRGEEAGLVVTPDTRRRKHLRQQPGPFVEPRPREKRRRPRKAKPAAPPRLPARGGAA